MNKLTITNRQWRVVAGSIIITVFGCITTISPWLFAIDFDKGGGALFVFGFLIAALGIIMALIYVARARAFDRTINGIEVLADWSYTPSEWQGFIAANYIEEKSASRGLFYLIAVISLVVGVVLSAKHSDPKSIAIITVIIISLNTILFFVSSVAPKMRRYRLSNSRQRRAVIGKRSIMLGESFWAWGMAGAKLESVSIENYQDGSCLVVVYSYPSQTGLQQDKVRVPIPSDKTAEANFVAGQMSL